MNGTYLFSMLMASTLNAGECTAQLKLNGEVLTETWLRDGPLTTYGTITGTAVTHCNPGDGVYVEVTSCTSLNSIHTGMTTFSGIILSID